MSNVHYLKDYAALKRGKGPREVRLFSAAYIDQNGQNAGINFTFRVENDEDLASIFEIIVENGGVGIMHDDGVYRWFPWPCAAMEIREVSAPATPAAKPA